MQGIEFVITKAEVGVNATITGTVITLSFLIIIAIIRFYGVISCFICWVSFFYAPFYECLILLLLKLKGFLPFLWD